MEIRLVNEKGRALIQFFSYGNEEKLFYYQDGAIHVGENDLIPRKCDNLLPVSIEEFEDAVLKLAIEINKNRALALGAIPRGSQPPAPKIIYAPSNITIAHIEQLLDIIQKLVEK